MSFCVCVWCMVWWGRTELLEYHERLDKPPTSQTEDRVSDVPIALRPGRGRLGRQPVLQPDQQMAGVYGRAHQQADLSRGRVLSICWRPPQPVLLSKSQSKRKVGAAENATKCRPSAGGPPGQRWPARPDSPRRTPVMSPGWSGVSAPSLESPLKGGTTKLDASRCVRQHTGRRWKAAPRIGVICSDGPEC